MSIFGRKSRKSFSSDTSSFSKQSPPHILDASDRVPASSDFGPALPNRRGPSHTSDSSSLLSRKSSTMKMFFGSTRKKSSQSIDAGSPAGRPTKPPPSSYSFNGASSKVASRTSLNNPDPTPATPPVITPTITPSTTTPSLTAPTALDTSFAADVAQSVSGALFASAAPSSAPRPSELFAGKGVQWNQIDLTARDITKPTDAANTTVDMQKFLKERRQWIPTFKDNQAVEDASPSLPKSLEQFTFETPVEVSESSAGLKSLKDLEDSHKRKAALLNPAPLASATNGTIFEEAGSSSSASPNASNPTALKSINSLPPPPAAPSRNQSFRTSAFVTSNHSVAQMPDTLSRKPAPSTAPNGHDSTPASTHVSHDVPQRRSSAKRDVSALADTEAVTPASNADHAQSAAQPPRPANARVDHVKEQAAIAATAVSSTPASATVHPSMQTSDVATLTRSLSQHSQPLASGVVVPQSTHDSASTIVLATSPPRPPRNDQRTPSRQNSKDPITNGVSKSDHSHKPNNDALVDKLAHAAPSLQNVLPGTGAATTRDA